MQLLLIRKTAGEKETGSERRYTKLPVKPARWLVVCGCVSAYKYIYRREYVYVTKCSVCLCVFKFRSTCAGELNWRRRSILTKLTENRNVVWKTDSGYLSQWVVQITHPSGEFGTRLTCSFQRCLLPVRGQIIARRVSIAINSLPPSRLLLSSFLFSHHHPLQ